MGNTVSASSPAEVRSIEAYLSENCENVESLGSTRFMKVAKARGENGYLKVYKVFINQDEALPQEDLARFQENLLQTGKTLSKESNCLPVRIVLNKGKDSILLVRSYQKYTLFDRLSTRPFINEQERIWYIYQLFKALDQCQRADIRHGDLKSQNVLLSSANWLQLTDFASFKPTFIQHDNPSHFTFFFDTSRRQTCHLAPERFLSSVEFESNFREKGNLWLFGGLTHAMDMFAAGCVVYEILCEGRAPFSYGQLCDYRNMSPAEAASHLEKLLFDIPVRFHVLLKLLLNRDPSFRLSAKTALKGDAFSFPPVLEWYYKYVEGLRPIEFIEENVNLKYEHEPNVFWSASHDSDYIISKLIADEENVFDHLKETEDSLQFAVLVISLITSNIRSLKGAQAKVDALRLLVKLSYLCDCTIALERILPYFVFMLSDQHVTVRVYAIHAIVDLIKPLEPTNVEQSLIFVDYILPEFMDMLEKKNPPMFVVQTLAANLGYVAQCAHRFHTVGWGLRSSQDDECSGAENLDQVRNRKEEMDALGKAIADLFTTLSTSENIIRHCLINTPSLAALFKFFSAIENKEDNNILIRHMITFLNSKVDWRLRTAVFDALPICLQKRTVDIRSLLQQGLHDFEELVVVHVLHCIHSLIATDLLDRHAVSELLKDVAPFLAHPNKWIRVCVINILVLLDSKLSLADVHSKLLVEIAGYLKVPLLRLNSKMVILRNLKQPIPRSLWKHLMNDLNDENMKCFVDRLQKAFKDGGAVQISEPWYKRIGKIGEDDAELKWKLLKFGNHFIKMAEFRKSAGMESELTMRKGKIDLTVHPLVKRNEHEYGRKTLPTSSIDTGCSLNNQEWNEMFSKPGESPITERPVSTNHVSRSTCGSQLQRLLSHKESLYMKGKGAHPELVGFTEIRPSTTSKVHGVMLTHLHEHTDKIVKISTSSEHLRVVTVSMDGSMKVWNERALIGECLGAVRSDFTFYPGHDEKHRVPLRAGNWMNKGQYFAVATAKGEFVIMDLSAPNEKIVSKVQLPKEDGPIEEVHTDNNIAFVRSHHGTIYCLDRRVGRTVGPLGKHEVWSRTVHNKHGLVASSCVDPWKANWMVMAVTNGEMILWDLRYQQEVSWWSAKKDSGVPVRLWSNPCSAYNDPQLFASSNIMGDVGIYDVARGNKSRVLWSSLHTPLTYKGERGDLSDALVTGALYVNQDTGEVFTGDSQGALRKWNLKKPHLSEYLSGNRKFQGNQKIGYQDVIVKDGDEEMPVIREYRSIASADELSPSSVSADVKGSTCHRTSITDIACLNRDLLASASAEGVIKIWK